MIKTPSDRHYRELVDRLRQPRLALVDKPERPRPAPLDLEQAARDLEAALRLLRMRRRRYVRKLDEATGHD